MVLVNCLTMSRFSFPDQVSKFKFFVLEGKDPSERDVPAACFWQNSYVVMIYVLLTAHIIFYTQVRMKAERPV